MCGTQHWRVHYVDYDHSEVLVKWTESSEAGTLTVVGLLRKRERTATLRLCREFTVTVLTWLIEKQRAAEALKGKALNEDYMEATSDNIFDS